MNDIPNCPECGTHFDDIFQATDHLLDIDEEPFDPALILPGGYRLMVGSMLRHLFHHVDEPEELSKIIQETYATLYAAEYAPDRMGGFIEEIIVGEHMQNLDQELKLLLNETTNDDESGA